MDIKCSDSLSCFKRHLSTRDTTVPLFYYGGNRKAEIIHCKLRLEISDLNYDLFHRHLTEVKACQCGHEKEDASHFLLFCPLFNNVRLQTLTRINLDYSVNDLLKGNPNLSTIENSKIFEIVQTFIIESGRFDV